MLANGAPQCPPPRRRRARRAAAAPASHAQCSPRTRSARLARALLGGCDHR